VPRYASAVGPVQLRCLSVCPSVFRPHRSNCGGLRYTVADEVVWSACVSVCWPHLIALQKRLIRSRRHLWGNSCGSNEPRGTEIPRKGKFRGLSGPISETSLWATSTHGVLLVHVNGSELVSISEVTLRRARLVLGWETVFVQANSLRKSICNQRPSRSNLTQASHPSVDRRNDYWR